jgi:hypothetical protein
MDVASFGSRAGPDTSQATWIATGRQLGVHRKQHQSSGSRLMWDIGDWLLEGEETVLKHEKRPTIRDFASQLTGYSRHTLTMAASVSRRVSPARRIEALSWWHHLVVANLGGDQQSEWLTRAVEYEWTVPRLRQELRASMPGIGPERPSPRKGDRVVRRLVELKREQISDALLAELGDWWQREMERAKPQLHAAHR